MLADKGGFIKSSGPRKCCENHELRDKGLGGSVLTGTEGGCSGRSGPPGQV